MEKSVNLTEINQDLQIIQDFVFETLKKENPEAYQQLINEQGVS